MEATKKKSFALGYSFVGHSFISFMFLAFVLVALSNEVFPDFIAKFAPTGNDALWNANTMSIANTACAVFASLMGVLIGQWVDKKGAKQVLVVGYFVGGATYFLFPFVPNFALFCVCLAITHTAMLCYAQMTASSLIAHWFNKKKGMALGIAAIGIPAGNAVFLMVYRRLSDAMGMRSAMWIFGMALVIMGFLSMFWVKNHPYEAGLTPDNLPMENNAAAPEDHSYRFSEVASTPLVWLMIIIYGLMNCAVIACVAQIRDYVIEKGVADGMATLIVSLGALGGIAGGFIISIMDQKMGTRKATILYSAISIVVYAAMFFAPKDNMVLIIVLCLLAFMLNGAPANLLPSMIITVFGPESFNSVSKIATPISCIFRSAGYYVATLFMTTIGGGNWAGVYIGISVIMVVALVLTIVLKDQPASINVKEENKNIIAMGETYFGFNQNFQGDIAKIKELLYGRAVDGIFKNRVIEQADIEEIVEAGILAPEDVDIRPWHFVAISDPATLRELRNLVYYEAEEFAVELRKRFPGHPEIKVETMKFVNSLNTAPLAVLAFTNDPVENDQDLANDIKHVASAIQNMLIKAYERGVGSYWLTSPIAAGIAPALKERFNAGNGEFVSIVTFGYPDETDKRPLEKKGYIEYI